MIEIEMAVSGLAIDERTHTPVVLLKEKAGTRMLPIWIGPSEASAIAIEHGAILVSSDRDFPRFPGLRWELPTVPGA